MREVVERAFFKAPRGLASRVRLLIYRTVGLHAGHNNRFERVRCRRPYQIELGNHNSFTDGCWLWPGDVHKLGIRIRIGSKNYFNRDVMIDAWGLVEIGDDNMFGPRVFITDSNHQLRSGSAPAELPMDVGHVRIGNRCWIGAGAVLLKDVELGDECVVAAGAVVTKSFPAGSVIAGVPAKALQARETSFRD